MVSEGGARVAAAAGGRVRTGRVGGGAKKPCVTMTMKAAPEATLVWNQWCRDLCWVDLPSSVCSAVPATVVAELWLWLGDRPCELFIAGAGDCSPAGVLGAGEPCRWEEDGGCWEAEAGV